ncbi:hypothetical protein [Sphingomonas sp. Leaf5]|uniref:hypothetical protein n=1 Tax=Sphingomonas sp. Leaf5 TaxID=1735671 RepID=UPI000B0F373E|nr:hypothetical protein [Sphingomonas sp. Leaf5]
MRCPACEGTDLIKRGRTSGHLIESSNASFRDMLACFNRRIKRASKTQQMLGITLDIFLAGKRLQSPT